MYTMELMTNDVGYKSFYKKTHLTTLQRDLKEHPIVFTEYSLKKHMVRKVKSFNY